MVIPYFVFKGIKSTDMGIFTTELPPDQTSDNDGDYIKVPGRDGYLYIDDGRKEAYDKIIKCMIPLTPNQGQLDTIKDWLSGSGELIISREPDIFYEARINSVRQYVGQRKNIAFNISFKCQPHKYYLFGKNPIKLTSTPTTINNPGKVSKPIIKITGSGEVSLSINSQLIQATIDGYLTIDSELMECYKDNELKTFTGPFPELIEGINDISWTGTVTEVEVIPRWHK